MGYQPDDDEERGEETDGGEVESESIDIQAGTLDLTVIQSPPPTPSQEKTERIKIALDHDIELLSEAVRFAEMFDSTNRSMNGNVELERQEALKSAYRFINEQFKMHCPARGDD